MPAPYLLSPSPIEVSSGFPIYSLLLASISSLSPWEDSIVERNGLREAHGLES